MVVSLFSQFDSPWLLNVPLILLAMVVPWKLFAGQYFGWAGTRSSLLLSALMEGLVSQVSQPLSRKGTNWVVLFSGLMLMIMTLNVVGLFPYTFTPTTQLSMNLGLAVPLWLGTIVYGFRTHPTVALAHLCPEGAPNLLIPMLIVVETLSILMRPLALGLRLTANLTAGHLLMHLISSAVMGLMSLSTIASFVTLVLLVFLTLLEMAVALIQGYVFAILVTLYLDENL
uniref:ATP synthase subunit a n=1 Tax=Epigonichthys maldivensis TaxID=231028 RepID=A0A182C3T3_9BRAN|nr:ATP synthase subunit 6 [Epigonichthys maldivensis]BAV13799.1 ATP synthase subunit 6 [Epigonichthys maldivensis]BAV13812.1 ATP synthase subunit 6 [Epigonichthys maldivensis]BAV13825.1 ATP synthase subunit 6 [Epigonichthys maldivensis]